MDHTEVKQREKETYGNQDGNNRMEYSALWDDEAMEMLLKKGAKRRWHDLRREYVPGADILDLAVGSGRHSVELADEYRAGSVTAIDIETSRTTNTHPSVTYVTADGEQLPFPDNSFEVVTITSAFHHFPRWRTVGLSEISRVLTDTGVFLFYEPGYWNPPAWFRRRFLRSASHTPDEQAFKPDELQTALDQQFVSVELDGYHVLSNMLPVAENYFPGDIPDKVYEFAVQLEQSLPVERFSWLLVGAAERPKST